MSDLEQFFTRELAEEGVDLSLYLPTGADSGKSIKLRGMDSDVFRTAELKAKRKAIEISQIKDDEERETSIQKSKTELIASLVISWTLDVEFTFENVVKLLTEAPQIEDTIDKFVSNRALFFTKKLHNSTSGLDVK